MTDISSLQKFLTEQPDKTAIAKMDRKLSKDEEATARSLDIKTRRNIKD